MGDEAIDLLDRRGRLIRLAIAVAIGLAVTLGVLALIDSAGVKKNPDAISQVMPFILGAALFALVTTGALRAINAITRRRRGVTQA